MSPACRCSARSRTASAAGRCSSRACSGSRAGSRASTARPPPAARSGCSPAAAPCRASPAARCCRSPSRWSATCGRTAAATSSSARSARRRSSAASSARCTGSRVAALLGSWRGIFWLNLPLVVVAIAARLAGRAGRPAHLAPTARTDLVGGLLLAVVLGAVVVALYNPDPSGPSCPRGAGRCCRRAAVTVLFVLWERRARTRLLDLSGAAKGRSSPPSPRAGAPAWPSW